MNVSEFRSQGTMRAITNSSKNEYGSFTATNVEDIPVWMKFEKIGGGTGTTQGQVISDASYKATMYYNEAFTTNWVLVFEGNTYNITNIKVDNEAYKRFMTMDCQISINQTSWS